MKKHFFLFLLCLALLPALSFAQAEDETVAAKPETPQWVSDKGYWVVESNKHTPKINTVYFYTLDHVLVYKEQVNGIKIKLNKKKVLMRLKTALDLSVTAWQVRQTMTENTDLVAIALKN